MSYYNKTAITLYGQCPKCKRWNFCSDVILHGPLCFEVHCYVCKQMNIDVTVVCTVLKHELPKDVIPVN